MDGEMQLCPEVKEKGTCRLILLIYGGVQKHESIKENKKEIGEFKGKKVYRGKASWREQKERLKFLHEMRFGSRNQSRTKMERRWC